MLAVPVLALEAYVPKEYNAATIGGSRHGALTGLRNRNRAIEIRFGIQRGAVMDGITRQLAKAQRSLDQGRGDEALALARELVHKHPRDAAALHFTGRIYCLADKARMALPYLRRASAAAPDDANIALTLARALAQSGLVAEAIEVVNAAERLHEAPSRATFDGQMLLGDLLRREQKFVEALACFVKARELSPADAKTSAPREAAMRLARTHNDAANVRLELGRAHEAVIDYRRAIELSPNFAEAWTNLAAALLASGCFEESAEAAQRAVKLAPNISSAWLTLGNALSEQGRWLESRQAFDALLSQEPLSREARYNRSLARLALGDWSAWEDYRLRHSVEPTVKVATGLPRWSGESLAERTILVRREQGIGTQIMFSRYVPELANLARGVIVECDPRLRNMFARMFHGVNVASTADIFTANGPGSVRWRVAPPDVEIAIGDLPGLLSKADRNSDWRNNVLPPRLSPDAELVSKWRARMSRMGPGPRIGISWRGGGTASARQKRSTTLDQWSPVFSVEGAEFVSLQYGDVRDDLAAFEQHGNRPLRRWDDFDPTYDLDDLAALVATLDLIVSIDNSTVHLAGAVGAPVWVLLPRAADWRWLTNCNDSPWYPSAELFRPQTAADDWTYVFSRIGERLGALVRNLRSARAHAG
jgi:tetratricopeptide (TPR) repeat protein